LKAYRPNEAGAIMIVMYHRFEKAKSTDLNRMPAEFRRDLENLYKRKYYPVTVKEIVEGTMDVPPGKTPVALTFDDSWGSQFKIVTGTDGNPHIDSDCAVGIMETFAKKYPDFPAKGTFFVLPKEGSNGEPFGQEGMAEQKLDYLLKHGSEVANHTSTHSNMRGMKPDKIQWEIATAIKDIKALAPGASMSTLALPYGNVPRSKEATAKLISGQDGTTSYQNIAVLRAAWRPILSPITKKDKKATSAGSFCVYDPFALERMTVDSRHPNVAGTFEYWLKYFDANPGSRYVSDGNVKVAAVPKGMKLMVDPSRVKQLGQTLQLYSTSGAAGAGPTLSVE
jgi:peptidoglycan/xylan/chitin deacetylase (PgdA/CDA1 family)